MSEYKEMNPFTGKEIDEDAPANASGSSVAGTGDDNTVHTMRKKKKKTLYDGRTKIAKKFIERIMKQREARLKTLTKEELKLDEGDIKKTQVKRTGNDFNIFYKGNTKYGRNKMIGYFVFDKGNFEVYHDNSDRQDDFQQSDMVKSAQQALDLIFDTANSNGVIKENVELMEKVDKKLALKILSMMKNQKFKKISGDFVPQIYLSGMDRDKLKKEFGRLPRGLPSSSSGVPVVDFINYAMGISKTVDGIDTEDGDKPQPKLYDYRSGKVIGKPRTVGDAAKMAGLRLEEVELDEAVSAKDKKVIDDFVQGKKGTGAQNFTKRGNIVDYEGSSLEKSGMGAQQIASVSASGVKIHAKMDGRSTQSIVSYLKKSAKKHNVKVTEETDIEEMPYYRKIYDKIHQITHPKGYDKIMKMYVDLHKQGHRNPAQAVGQQVSGVQARDVAYYINGLIKKGKLPSALAAEVEPKKFSQKVKEQADNFGKEWELVENNLKILQNIVKKKQNQNVRLDNKNVKVDLYTASAIMNVYNAVSKDNKKKMEKMMNGNLNQFLKLQGAAFKLNR